MTVPDDVGRRFRATRILELDIQLSTDDVVDQIAAGESALESAHIIAGSTPDAQWTVMSNDVEELS